LGWLLLEVIVALGIAVAIVWWTFPRKPKADDAARAHDEGER